MRLHVWDDDNVPPFFTFLNKDTIQLFDYPHWVGFEVGDQIQYMTALGTEVYFVVDVQPEYDENDIQQMSRVTIEAA